MSGILNIGISGLNAASLNLATVSHNISNSDTAGYSRQSAVQATNTPLTTGSGFIGQGTHVTTVVRLYSSFLTKTLNATETKASELSTNYTELSKIDNMLSNANSGLSTATDTFFAGVNDAATNPSENSSRQSMISTADALVSRYQALNDQLNQLYGAVNTQITSTVDSINTYATQIATLNKQIAVAQSANRQPANDLLDKRDQLVSDLNKLVKVSTSINSNGTYDVYFGTGQQLVVNTTVSTLVAVRSSADQSRWVIGQVASSGTQELPESLITGGTLAGLLKFRSESLDKTANDLGANATALAVTFNAQYALGQDENGAVDGDAGFENEFFKIDTSNTVIASRLNTGTAVPTISLSPASIDASDGHFYTDLTGDDYSLTYDGANYTLTNLANPSKTWSGDIATINSALVSDPQGFSLVDPGSSPAAGDSYLIQPTRGAAGQIEVNTVIANDTTLVALAAPMRTATGTGNTGSATISQGSVTTGYVALGATTPLNPALTLTYDSATTSISWPATLAADGVTTIAAGSVAYVSGSTISIAGNNVVISGTPLNGDTFTIERNASATSDSRNALALVKLQTQKTMSGGASTYQESYATLVSYIGNKTNEVSVTSDAQEALVTQASDAVDALSGVNLDEEAAALIKYQQAYQACAKVIATASTLFDSILQILS